ncbi:MAG: glycosyltransferase 87 family protein [Acidobacteriota bacterium]|nr:glycosyltransferase 87 family protein [Acidobacteriota bacterium]
MSARFPSCGLKIHNVLYLILTLFFLTVIVQKKDEFLIQRLCAIACVCYFCLIPNRLWYELFTQGVNDIFPILLIILAFYFIKIEKWGLAGLFIGLSFSAKFAPAAFLMCLFLRRDLKVKLFIGFFIGLMPIFAFMIWDAKALINNAFLCRFILEHDSTSLYSISPKQIYFIFPLVQLAAIVIMVTRNFNKKVVLEELVFHFSVLVIIITVAFKAVHTNYLIWICPITGYLLTTNRYNLNLAISRIMRVDLGKLVRSK